MVPDAISPSNEEIEARIQQVGGYSRIIRIGFLIILSALVLAVGIVLPANLSSPAQAIESILMPLTFVGLGMILYGIGMHLHLMHLNLVRKLQTEQPDEEESVSTPRD